MANIEGTLSNSIAKFALSVNAMQLVIFTVQDILIVMLELLVLCVL
ncbi:MAG: hypothetical protein MJ209_04845 [archaeon]|nr:hypothetical protein [archaeon]